MKNAQGEQVYKVFAKVLDASEHGLPQSRKRLFVFFGSIDFLKITTLMALLRIALKKSLQKRKFKWPVRSKKIPELSKILEKTPHGDPRRSLAFSNYVNQTM